MWPTARGVRRRIVTRAPSRSATARRPGRRRTGPNAVVGTARRRRRSRRGPRSPRSCSALIARGPPAAGDHPRGASTSGCSARWARRTARCAPTSSTPCHQRPTASSSARGHRCRCCRPSGPSSRSTKPSPTRSRGRPARAAGDRSAGMGVARDVYRRQPRCGRCSSVRTMPSAPSSGFGCASRWVDDAAFCVRPPAAVGRRPEPGRRRRASSGRARRRGSRRTPRPTCSGRCAGRRRVAPAAPAARAAGAAAMRARRRRGDGAVRRRSPSISPAAGIEVLVPTALTKTLTAEAHVEPPPGAGDAPAASTSPRSASSRGAPTIDGEPVSRRRAGGPRRDAPATGEAPRRVGGGRSGGRREVGRRDRISGRRRAVGRARRHRHDRRRARRRRRRRADRRPGRTGSRGAAAPARHRPTRRASHAELRPYQRRGVAWIEEMAALGFGGVLADDMGLGKTIQVIAPAPAPRGRAPAPDGRRRRSSSARPSVVVATGSARSNGSRRRSRCAATTAPSGRSTASARDEVVVTTYGLARRDRRRSAIDPLGPGRRRRGPAHQEPELVDGEGAAQIPADARLALTGTPVENRLTELWALLDWTTPGLLGVGRGVPRTDRDPDRAGPRRGRRPARFARMIAPFLLRRRKDDPTIAPDLPPKTETDHPVLLTAEQAGLYRATVDEILEPIDRSRRHRPPRAGAQAAHRAQADLQPPGALPGPAAAARRAVGQARRVRRAGRRHQPTPATRRWSSPSTWRWATC